MSTISRAQGRRTASDINNGITTVTFIASVDVWPRAVETEKGATLCAIGHGKGLFLSIAIGRDLWVKDRSN